jgi:hypothetical protein
MLCFVSLTGIYSGSIHKQKFDITALNLDGFRQQKCFFLYEEDSVNQREMKIILKQI